MITPQGERGGRRISGLLCRVQYVLVGETQKWLMEREEETQAATRIYHLIPLK